MIHIDQIPGGQREHVQIRAKFARRVALNGQAIAIGEPANSSARPAFGEFHQRSFHFSDQDGIETRVEIFQHMIGRIGAVSGDRNTPVARRGSHRKREFAIAPQTHLGEEVKIVFTNHYQAWPMSVQRGGETLLGSVSNVGSNSATLMPRSRNTAAASRVCSGGYGCIFFICLRSK